MPDNAKRLYHTSQLTDFRNDFRHAVWISAGLTVLVILGNQVYGLDIFDGLTFLLISFLAFYTLGAILITILFGTRQNSTTGIVFSLGVGTVVFPMIYHFLRHSEFNMATLILVISAQFLIWLFLFIKRKPKEQISFQHSRKDIYGVAFLIVYAVGLLCLSHFNDLRLQQNGFLYGTSYLTESVFHLGLIESLEGTYPPPSLYTSGLEDFSGYHLNMHLQIELFNRIANVDSIVVASYWAPFLYFSLLLTIPFVFVRLIGGNVVLAVFSSILIVSTDFSFIPGLLNSQPSYPWTLYFTTTIWSLFTLNGYLPSLIALSCYMVFFYQFLNLENRLMIIGYFLCIVGAYGFKSSMGLQLAATGIGFGVLLIPVKRRRREALLILTASTIALAFLMWLAWSTQAISRSGITIAPFNTVSAWMESLRLGQPDASSYIVMVPMLFLGSLGIRTICFLPLGRQFTTDNPKDLLLGYIVLFLVGGFVLANWVFIGNPGSPINNSIWFYVQGLMATLFALFIALERLWRSHPKYIATVAVTLLLLSYPTTIQFLTLRTDQSYAHFDQGELAIVEYLKTTAPQSVVLHPLNVAEPSLASNFAGRPSVLNVFRSFVESTDVLKTRVSDSVTFFKRDTEMSERIEILTRYEVNFVYAPTALASLIENTDGLNKVIESESIVLFQFLTKH